MAAHISHTSRQEKDKSQPRSRQIASNFLVESFVFYAKMTDDTLDVIPHVRFVG
jgi:Flp pilus assembly protein TadG